MNWELIKWILIAIAGAFVGIFVRTFWDKIEPLLIKIGKWLAQSFLDLRDRNLAKATYYRYKVLYTPLIESSELISHLEARYNCTAFTLAGQAFPVSVIWKNTKTLIRPDEILGKLDKTDPKPLLHSPVLSSDKYAKARKFIRRKLTTGPIKYEGHDYCMTHIDLAARLPKIHGAKGLYYDNILTQYALEWELKKALRKSNNRAIHSLFVKGTLPLRESIESKGNPFLAGSARCAAITISTLLVFNRAGQGFHCLMQRRSGNVAVSQGMMHVVPAGMFESKIPTDNWSVEMNIWRELLEEVYNVEEQQGTGNDELPEPILNLEPIRSLITMLEKKSAHLSVTGIVCDLLNLRPEICTVLFVEDPNFSIIRGMNLNWEYADRITNGTGAVPWLSVDEVIKENIKKHGFVASGAACLGLGIEWIRNQHKL